MIGALNDTVGSLLLVVVQYAAVALKRSLLWERR